MAKEANLWQWFIGIANIGEMLSVADIVLTLIGFTITVLAAYKAKRAADLAFSAAQAAKQGVRQLDLISEISAVIHLLEELKSIQRTGGTDLLLGRYSAVRIKVVEIRESGLLSEEIDQVALQDVVTRLRSLEVTLDKNVNYLGDKKNLAKCNESVSFCTDLMLGVKVRLHSKVMVIQ